MITWLVQSTEMMPNHAEWLNSAEQMRYNALKTDKRRRDWLLGRWTAKQLIADTTGPLPLHEIEIANRDTGEPTFTVQGNAGMGQLTISHSHGHAFCALLCDDCAALGADMELIEPRRPVFVADYFTDAEKERVAAVAPESQPAVITAVWSAKEAALKAAHTGLSVDTRSVSCLIGPDGLHSAEWRSFTIDIDRRRLPDAPALRGWWRTLDPFVLTIATTDRDDVGHPIASREQGSWSLRKIDG